ncbi:hypothetical protein [Collimonas sp. OK607]|nr:hypothetical protein [Collimonas sp. OK607]
MLSVNELAKTGVLMTACMLGLVELFLLGRPRMRQINGMDYAIEMPAR